MKMKRMHVLWRILKGSRLAFLSAALCIALAALISLVDPLIIRFTVDSILAGKDIDAPDWLVSAINAIGGVSLLARHIWLCALALGCAGAFNALFMFLRGALAARAAENSAYRLRTMLFQRLNQLPYRYFATASTGDLVQRCTSDVDTIRRFLATQFVDMGRAIALLSFTVIVMANVDRGMTLVALPIVPLIIVFSYLFFRKIQAAFLASDEAEGELSRVLQEGLQGVRVVRAFARQDFERQRFDARNRHFTAVTRRLIDLFGWYWSISGWMCMAQTAVVLVVGAMRASAGIITAGTFITFLAYVSRLMWPVRQLGRTLTDLGKTLVALDRVGDILGQDSEFDDDGQLQPDMRGDIEFRDVQFAYEPGHPVLNGISFRIAAGETVAILGRTGSGKSALVHLLSRMADPDAGSIQVGGVDITTIRKSWLRNRVGLVTQEPFLFSRTLSENVAMGCGGAASVDELAAVAALAGMGTMLESFSKGWDTAVGEEGVTLSGGQRQRAAIARVLLKQPDVLVLDDALSAVDTETDAAIRAALKAAERSVTTIIVSHRMTTLAAADRIIVMEHGRIADIGSHAELVARPGLYRRVWEIQQGLEAAMEDQATLPHLLDAVIG
jgi:ATP-binding cassette subfamily B protein